MHNGYHSVRLHILRSKPHYSSTMLADDGVSEGLLLGLFDAIDLSSAARSGLLDIPNFSRKDIVDDDLIDDAVLRLESE